MVVGSSLGVSLEGLLGLDDTGIKGYKQNRDGERARFRTCA